MKRLLITFLSLSSMLMLSALLVGGQSAAAIFGTLAVLFPVALMALGALKEGRLGRVGGALCVLAGVLLGGLWAMLSLRGLVEEGAWILGLPAAAVILLGLFWLGPLVLISLVYAGTFKDHGITDKGLARLRQASGKKT